MREREELVRREETMQGRRATAWQRQTCFAAIGEGGFQRDAGTFSVSVIASFP